MSSGASPAGGGLGSPNVCNEAHTENPQENAKRVTMISLVILSRESLYVRQLFFVWISGMMLASDFGGFDHETACRHLSPRLD